MPRTYTEAILFAHLGMRWVNVADTPKELDPTSAIKAACENNFSMIPYNQDTLTDKDLAIIAPAMAVVFFVHGLAVMAINKCGAAKGPSYQWNVLESVQLLEQAKVLSPTSNHFVAQMLPVIRTFGEYPAIRPLFENIIGLSIDNAPSGQTKRITRTYPPHVRGFRDIASRKAQELFNRTILAKA